MKISSNEGFGSDDFADIRLGMYHETLRHAEGQQAFGISSVGTLAFAAEQLPQVVRDYHDKGMAGIHTFRTENPDFGQANQSQALTTAQMLKRYTNKLLRLGE